MFRPKSTFEQWRIFQAVVDCGGYAQAADALNKSQSSLNHAVAKLQQSLGVPLLEVRGRKAVLTPAGEIFLKRARQLSQQVEELENLANNLERQWEPQINLYVSALQPRDRLIGRWPASIPAAGVAGSTCTNAFTATSTPCNRGI